MAVTDPRRCVVLRGTPDQTRRAAVDLVRDGAEVLWVGEDPGDVHPGRLPAHLGRGYDGVVVDLHRGLDADVLAAAHGFVWGGGALVLRLPVDPPPTPSLAVWPYLPEDAGHHLWTRLETALARSSAGGLGAIVPTARPSGGTVEQQALVDALVARLTDPTPSASVVLADRGRGKSAALGLALARLPGARIAVTGPAEDAVREVLRFAPDAPWVPPIALAAATDVEVLAIDEAAQLPVALLQRIVLAHPRARLVFATTARGYEGTGRGFVLRFLDWLAAEARPVAHHTLVTPIRFAADDPVERLVHDVLLLDADPGPPPAAEPVAGVVDRDALAADEPRLRAIFGLLVHAHYRTTPGDLHRLLDAPNLAVHTLEDAGRIGAACVIAHEGGLDAETCDRMVHHGLRIRGHALPDTLVVHAGHAEAGALTFVRSVRIAVHPEARRAGLGRALADAVHGSYAPDAFGTLFGATPELLRFRRDQGYVLVRVGISRGGRTGQPAAILLRPVSDRATVLVDRLSRILARDLPRQLELLQVDGELLVDPALLDALRADLPEPLPITDADIDHDVRTYALGQRPMESAATALEAFLARDPARLADLDPRERAIVVGRVVERRAWVALAAGAGWTVPTAMRAMRRAIRSLLQGR